MAAPWGKLCAVHLMHSLRLGHCEQSLPLTQGSVMVPVLDEKVPVVGPCVTFVAETVEPVGPVGLVVVLPPLPPRPPLPVGVSTKTLPPQAPSAAAAIIAPREVQALMLPS